MNYFSFTGNCNYFLITIFNDIIICSCELHGHWPADTDDDPRPCGILSFSKTKLSRNVYNQLYQTLENTFNAKMKAIAKRFNIKKVHIQYSCRWLELLRSPGPVQDFYQGREKLVTLPGKAISCRDALKGGRTSLFSLCATTKLDSKFRLEYHDVNSKSYTFLVRLFDC